MSITNRLTWFFLAALGVVLVSFSSTLFLLARWHLHAETERHLEAAMHVLVAAIEVHPDDVQWEPHERKVPLGDGPELEAVRWTIRDEAGRHIDRSINAAPPLPSDDDGQWLVLARRVQAGDFKPIPLAAEWSHLSAPADEPLPEDRSAQRQQFNLTVGLSTAPMRATLLNLAWALVGVSTVTWLVAAVGSRWLCGRALLPVRAMADSARALERAPDSRELLAVTTSDDELSDLGHAFNDLLRMLRESLDRQRRFATDASHQLRTPLTAILAAVDVSLRHPREAEMYRRVLEVVQRRGRELTNITETLLLLTRDDQQAAAGFRVVDLVECCRERIAAWQDHARADDLHLRADADAIRALSHPLLVGQVIDNLIDNACKYSEPGTPVDIRVWIEGKSVAVSVQDRGIGISAEELAQVFDPFFRGAEARWLGRPGAGLGLSIARRLATLAGGRLEADSEPGGGSKFRLLLAPPLPEAALERASSRAQGAHDAEEITEIGKAGIVG